MTRIGFIGLGNMGLPMALNLVKAGHQVTGFDLAPSAIEKLVTGGGKAAAEAIGAAVDVEVVITMLPSGKEARATYLGPDGLVAKVAANTLLIDCSTIDVATAREIGAAAAARGLRPTLKPWARPSYTPADPETDRSPKFATTWCSACR